MSQQDFAKASLVELIILQLKANLPNFQTGLSVPLDTIRRGNIPLEIKQQMLQLLWTRVGPRSVLSTGKRIVEIIHDPLWYSALNSQSPEILFAKWSRFEVYAHSNHRLNITKLDQNRYRFRHYALTGENPHTSENFLICGLLIAILVETGCVGLGCEIINGDNLATVYKHDEYYIPDEISKQDTTAWVISWEEFDECRRISLINYPLSVIPLPISVKSKSKIIITRMVRLLMQDITRMWKIPEIANELSVSTRSLQRNLADADLSFSQIVRLLRVHESCRLLEETESSITIIGFCSGFSDAAHFSKDFKMSMGMTPSEYREAYQSAEQ